MDEWKKSRIHHAVLQIKLASILHIEMIKPVKFHFVSTFYFVSLIPFKYFLFYRHLLLDDCDPLKLYFLLLFCFVIYICSSSHFFFISLYLPLNVYIHSNYSCASLWCEQFQCVDSIPFRLPYTYIILFNAILILSVVLCSFFFVAVAATILQTKVFSYSQFNFNNGGKQSSSCCYVTLVDFRMQK